MGSLLFSLTVGAGAQTTYAPPAPQQYQITVNTSLFQGTNGNVDFQFDPGTANPITPANVSVTNFTSDGTLGNASTVMTMGNASGSLPGTVTLTDDGKFQTNELYQGFTYGKSLNFLATFSGAALSNPSGTAGDTSTFFFSLFDNALNPVGTSDASGAVASITINNDGSITTQTYPNAMGGASLASISPAPEAGEWAAMGVIALGMGGLLVCARRRRAKA